MEGNDRVWSRAWIDREDRASARDRQADNEHHAVDLSSGVVVHVWQIRIERNQRLILAARDWLRRERFVLTGRGCRSIRVRIESGGSKAAHDVEGKLDRSCAESRVPRSEFLSRFYSSPLKQKI